MPNGRGRDDDSRDGIALYILFCAVVSVVTTIFLPGRTNRDISEEPAYGAAAERGGRAGRPNLKIGAGPCAGGGSVPYFE
jgi:hypothetical protein